MKLKGNINLSLIRSLKIELNETIDTRDSCTKMYESFFLSVDIIERHNQKLENM